MAAVTSDVCVSIAEGDLESDVLRLFWAYKRTIENGLIPRGSTSIEKSNDLKYASHKDLFDGSPSPSAFASYELLMNSYKMANNAAYEKFSFEGQPAILKAFMALVGFDIPRFTKRIYPEEASQEDIEFIGEILVDQVEALFLEVKEIVRRETGFEGSQPEVFDFVNITLQSDDDPTLFVFAHTVLCLIVGYFAVEEMMVLDGAAPDNPSVDAAAKPVTSSAAASNNPSVNVAAKPMKPAEEPADNDHSKPFCYDLYLYVAYKYHLIQRADYFALRSRQIRHHFTENIGKSVILLSYAYRSKFQENLAGALSLMNVNLPVHNTVKYIKDLVSAFSPDDTSFVYEYMVLLGFISEVTLEIYRRNKETDPFEGYINAACKYFRECGMLNFEEMLRSDYYITLNDFANHLAKSWELMQGLVESSQKSLGIASNDKLKSVASHLPNETSNDRDSSEGPKPEGGAVEGRSGPEGGAAEGKSGPEGGAAEGKSGPEGGAAEGRSGPESKEDESLDKVAKCPEEESSSDEESELKDDGVTEQPDTEGGKDDESRKPGEDGTASKEEDDESEVQLGGAVGRSNPEGKEDVKGWKPKPKGKKSKNKKKGRR